MPLSIDVCINVSQLRSLLLGWTSVLVPIEAFSLVSVHDDPVFVVSTTSKYLLRTRHHDILVSDAVVSDLKLILRLGLLKHGVVFIYLFQRTAWHVCVALGIVLWLSLETMQAKVGW